MSTILVFAEFKNGKTKSGTLELLSAAKASGNTVRALVLGAGAKAVATELGHYGASEVFICEHESYTNYNPESFTAIVSQVVKSVKPDLLLASGTTIGRDLFARVAAHLGCGIASDCTSLSIKGSDVKVRKPLYAGKCTAEVNFENSPTRIVVMRSNQLPVAAPDTSATAQITEVAPVVKDFRTIIKEVVQGTSAKLDLTEANIIVSGGRGMKGPEHFKLLHDLADVLGASVGASRAVVDEGWVPHSQQIGQTGKTVSPSLYIACGIQGAIQHLAGMSSSKVIVAINNNPEAPIFKKATYGIVGDVFEVLPILTAEFKKILAN